MLDDTPPHIVRHADIHRAERATGHDVDDVTTVTRGGRR